MTSSQRPFESRRGQVEGTRHFEGGVAEESGFFLVDGPGQGLYTVEFVVWFVEKPVFTFGFEKVEGQVLTTTGFYPTFSMMVDEWTTTERQAATYHVGARFAVAFDAQAGLKVEAHWTMTGRALRNPVNPA